MRFDNLKRIDEEKFRRITGIKRSTFNKMVEILSTAQEEKKQLVAQVEDHFNYQLKWSFNGTRVFTRV